jgi:hypothetical protein
MKFNEMGQFRDPDRDNLLLELPELGSMKQDYKKAYRMALWRLHADEEYGHEDRLGRIVANIKQRTVIIKKEIFHIGELLTEAKQIVGHGNFKQWVADTFDFSYETANNCMNVYKACLGHPEIVTTIKASVLYKIAAPGFPTDLREYIFEHGNSRYTNSDIQDLLDRYKAGELDLGSAEVKKFFNQNQKWQQLGPIFDRLTLCIVELPRRIVDMIWISKRSLRIAIQGRGTGLVMDLPQKGNGRPGFHESAIFLLQQGMEAGTSLAVRPCLSFLPCLIQARPWKTKKQAKDQRVRFIYLKIHFLSRHLP